MGACHPRRGGEIPSRKTANVITWWFYYRISQTSCALIGADSGRVNISSGWGGKESTPVGLQGIFQRQGGLNGNKPLPLPRTDCLGHKELRRHWFLYLIRLPALSLSLSLWISEHEVSIRSNSSAVYGHLRRSTSQTQP